MENVERKMQSALAAYCSQAERCLSDARRKMQGAGLSEAAEGRITDFLAREGFIDEARYCRSFVNDKFKFNRWGRLKIGYELKMKGIKPELCAAALAAIDEEEYMAALGELLESKRRSVKGCPPAETAQKLFRFAAARGFETPVIARLLKEIEYDE